MGFDIAIGIVLLLGAIRGFKKGFARQILTISSIVIAFVFAKTLAERLASPLAKFLQDYPDQISESIVYTGSLLGIFLTINLVGTLYLYVYRTRTMGVNVPSVQDRIVGILVGVVVAGFVGCVLIAQYERLPSMIRENDAVQSHYTASHGVKLAQEHRIAARVWETPEVQRTYEHMGRLVSFFRPSVSESVQTSAAE